jgi:SAM-dependent methyltransferase
MNSFNQYSNNYHQTINTAISFSGRDHDFFTRAKARWLRRLISETGRPDARVLDIGCGHGDIHPYLTDLSCTITGIDPAEDVIEQARELQPTVNYETYDGLRLPCANGAFDLAFTICVMHHVPPSQWQCFAEEMFRVTNPGGWCAVFEHNPFNPFTQLIVRGCEIDRDAVLLTSGTLRGLLATAGFRNIQTRYIIFTPWESEPFKKLEQALGWLPLGAQYFVKAQKPQDAL